MGKIEGGYAYAPFTATMKKTDDSDFRDMRITGTFVLTKEGDDWKILTIDYETEYLDE
jgi:ketosteroid isomerase-like protein